MKGSILNCLDALVAVLDQEGNIVDANAAWVAFAKAQDIVPPEQILPGANYIEACRRSDHSLKLLQDIRTVLGGGILKAVSEYSFQSGGRTFCFMSTVTPGPDRRGVVVTQVDITAQKQEQASLRRQDEQFRKIIDSTIGFVSVLAPDGTVIEANGTSLRAGGLRREEVVGKKFWDCYWWCHDPAVQEQLKEVASRAASGEVVRLDIVCRGAHGSAMALDFMIAPICDSSGAVTHLIPSAVNVTARRAAEQALRQSQERLFEALDAARVMSTDWDLRTDTLHRSPNFDKIMDYDPDRTTGIEFFTQVHPEDRESLLQIIRSLSPDNPQLFTKYRYTRRTDGRELLLEARGRAEFDETGKVIRIRGLTRDITEERDALQTIEGQKRRMELSLRCADAGAWEYDLQTGENTWSEGMGTLFGIPNGKVPSQSEHWLSYIHPEDRPAIEERLKHATYRANDHWSGEFRVVRPDGVMRWFSSRGSVISGPGGGLKLVGINQDITEAKRLEEELRKASELLDREHRILLTEATERVRAEQSLRESEERFRMMADGAPIVIWVADRKGRTRFVNKTYCEYFNTTAEAIKSHTWRVTVHPGDRKLYVKSFLAAVREGRPFHACVRVQRHDGAWRWIESRGQPLVSEQGELVGMAGTSVDVTEQREFQAELERQVAERTAGLQQAVAELEHFSYTITHDMRAPLRAMQGFADIVVNTCGECRGKQCGVYLDRIRTSAERMDSLIRDALSYTKAVRQKLPLERVDVAALLKGMLDSYPEFQHPNATVTVVGEIPPVVANQAGLTQCLSNLLANAVKFVRAGEKPSATVWAEVRDNWVRIWVEDNGIGVPEWMLPKLFQMFTRGHKGYEGTGIGLALAHKVVERMGGRMGVESQEGKGSRFWIELPAAEKTACDNLAATIQAKPESPSATQFPP